MTSETWRPPIGAGAGAGPPSPRRVVDAGSGGQGPPREDKDRRISPNPQTVPGDPRLHWEYMEKGRIQEKNGETITIDIDRDGGVFLDHGELARILAGQKDDMIKNINFQIKVTKENRETYERENPKCNWVK